VISGSSAGFGRRAAALIYDSLLLAALLMVFTGAALFCTHGRALLYENVGPWVYLYRAGLVAVIGAYYLINWMRSGQTLGMRAWHLRVVSDLGRRVTLKAALLRCVCGILAWTPAAAGVLWLYLDPDHLAIHDRLSRTRMVQLTRS
jgi:uncharacterized RDD family membrane protein YckC